MKLKTMLLGAAFISGLGITAFAATTQTVTFTATVPSILELATTSNAVTLNLTASDYAASDAILSEVAAAHQLSVRSNRAWIINVRSVTASFAFTPSNAGDTRTKPSTDLSVRKAGGTYQNLSTSNVTLASGTAGGVTNSGNTFDLDYRIATDITLDPPGSYALDVLYTLAAP